VCARKTGKTILSSSSLCCVQKIQNQHQFSVASMMWPALEITAVAEYLATLGVPALEAVWHRRQLVNTIHFHPLAKISLSDERTSLLAAASKYFLQQQHTIILFVFFQKLSSCLLHKIVRLFLKFKVRWIYSIFYSIFHSILTLSRTGKYPILGLMRKMM
jgi:hypothetical protein